MPPAAPSLYFAYGSNMHEPQMQSRAPGSVKVATGFLAGHEFVFSGYSQTWGGSVANVAPKRGSRVFGVLYELPSGGLSLLDRFEGYPRSYQRKVATITTIAAPRRPSRKVKAVLYFKRDRAPLAPPNPDYVDLIDRALAAHGAP